MPSRSRLNGRPVRLESETNSASRHDTTFRLRVVERIARGQTVTLGYTDPTALDDANAIQDEAGNDVPSFTVTLTNLSTFQGVDPGKPSVAGTADVGEALTASPGTIDDLDGVTAATYSYQWVRNDGNRDTRHLRRDRDDLHGGRSRPGQDASRCG